MGASASAISPFVAPASEPNLNSSKDPSEPRNPLNRLSVSYSSDYNNGLARLGSEWWLL